jgi:hypothetical protein
VKLAWVGTYSFLNQVKRDGVETAFIRMSTPRVLDWEDICSEAGFEPDVLVYSDRSLPLPLVGLEHYPCLTCFYVVDSHIHGWYPAYAQAFDCRAVSLRDHIPDFENRKIPGSTIWLPPYPRDRDQPIVDAEPRWDVLFVGNVDPETTPKRAVFLDEIERLLPGRLHVTKGDYHELYPYSRVVLNVAERDDLNFRVFEALGCGACLLTPRIGHGQDELFEPGRCLELYENLDAANAVAHIKSLLADPERCAAMARAGSAEIERAHRMKHRAADLITLLESQAAQDSHEERLCNPDRFTANLRLLYLHWADSMSEVELRTKYVAAARAAVSR